MLAIPRFDLVAACRADRSVLRRPIATVAHAQGGSIVQEPSAAAEDQGVGRGMRLARALALCPALRIATSDPIGAEELWEGVVEALEGIGAEVESGRAGEAYFAVDPLQRIHGGASSDVLVAARRAVPLPVRGAVAPARFAAFLAAVMPPRESFRGRERVVLPGEIIDFLAPLSISSLIAGPGLPEQDAQQLVGALDCLGIETLGALAALAPDHLADRFGQPGLRARRLARGEDVELEPRTVRAEIVDEIELEDGAAGVQLERGLELLVERVLSSPKRKDRTVLAVRLGARLAEGGSWSVDQVLGSPTARVETLASLLLRRLSELPGSPSSLSLHLTALGPMPADQLELPGTRSRSGDDRLAEAIEQVRAIEGPEALLSIVEVEPVSRVPERRALLAPRRRKYRTIPNIKGQLTTHDAVGASEPNRFNARCIFSGP